MKLSNRLLLLLIIAVAIALRFSNLFEIPLTHDELSALVRTNFDNFSDLIAYGVKTDTHPAGVQVFIYYWIQLFGTEQWVIKLPFLIMGIATIPLIFSIGKYWYNETVGLIAAAFVTGIQYTIIHGQMARPYVSGLFLTLLMVYFLTKMIKFPEKNYLRNSLFFVLTGVLSAYNHHFSLLFAALIGISGIFFIERKKLVFYLVSGVLIFVLYIPHLSIFFTQLGHGGIEGWLSKPNNSFFIDYLFYACNYSYVVVALVLGIILFGLFKKNRRPISVKDTLLFAFLFLAPLLIGFFYSKYVSAVLQFSILLFSFPYLLFLVFGHIKNLSVKTNLILVALILLCTSLTTIFERKHYELFYNSPIKRIVVDYSIAQKEHPDLASLFYTDKHKVRYFYKKYNVDTNSIWLNDYTTPAEIVRLIKTIRAKKSYLYFGSNASSHPLTVAIIKDYFPTIVWQKNYAGGSTYLFSSKKSAKEDRLSVQGFERNNQLDHWDMFPQENIIDSLSFSGNNSYYIDSTVEWSPGYSIQINDVLENENDFIDISLKIFVQTDLNEALIVSSIDAGKTNIYWNATDAAEFQDNLTADGKWINAHHSVKLSDINLEKEGTLLKVYIWNKGKQPLIIDDFSISIRKGNPIIYGIVERF